MARRRTTELLGWFSDGMLTVAMTIMVFELQPSEHPTFAALFAASRRAKNHLR
jgi:uncharacterized membrane protein